jgi:hypothetical protein
MTLAQSIAAFAATASIEAFIAGRRVRPLSCSVELGFDIISSSAEITLPSIPSWLELRQEMEIWLGWDGQTMPVFKGFVEDHEPGYDEGGVAVAIKAAGYLKATQYQYWDGDDYIAETDGTIVEDLLDKVGITERSIQEWGELFGVIENVVLDPGEDVWDLINRLDQVTGYKTYDGPDGVVRRRRISGNPSGTAARTLTEGVDIFSIRRPRTIRGIHNAVIVTGMAQELITPVAERRAENPLVPTPPQYIAFEFQSDLIEDNDMCEAVAERLMLEVNRVVEEVPVEIKGDPRRKPGETIGVVSSRVGLSSSGKYWCRHITHQFNASGFQTTLLLEGGIGSAGYETDLDPIAAFTYRLTRETFDVGGTPTDYWTVTCDGTPSSDLDGYIAIYAWENNHNGDVAGGATVGPDFLVGPYSTKFVDAEIGTATITLTVTDNDANVNVLTQSIVATNQNTNVRDLYIAAGSRADATSDGGANWQTWTPGAGTVVSTPPIAGEDHSYFGLSNGKLYRTDDYLDTTPIEMNDFGSQVNAIWIHEIDANHVTVGLQNGEVWRTLDADQLGSSTWALLKDYGNAVLDIVASFAGNGQYRVATGDEIRITYSDFAADEAVIDFDGGIAWRIISSLVNLPGKGAAAAVDPVKSEDGTAYTFDAATPTDVRAATHHIRQDVLYIADVTGKVWATQEGGTEFSQIGLLGSGDQANQMIRDGDNQAVLYAAGNDAAWKTFDGGLTWGILRDYSAGGLVGHQMGYGGLRALGIVPVTIFSTAGNEKYFTLWPTPPLSAYTDNDPPPSGWLEIAFDDSGWTTSVDKESTSVIVSGGFYESVPGADFTGPATGDGEPRYGAMLMRRTFVLTAGVITEAVLTISIDDFGLAHGGLDLGVWLNGVFIDGIASPGATPRPPNVITLDPALLLPGATNVLCVYSSNTAGSATSPMGNSYTLVIT